MTDIAAPVTTGGSTPPTGGPSPSESQPKTSTSEIPNNSKGNVPRETSDSKDPAKQPGETKAQWEKRAFKLKIDNQEIEKEYATEEDLVRDLQKALSADKRFEEANMSQAQFKAGIKKFFEDPNAFLKDPRSGFTKEQRRAIFEKGMYEFVEEDLMDPKDLELKKYKDKEARDNEAKKLADEEAAAKDLESRKETYGKSISKVMLDTLSAPDSPLPINDPSTVKDIASLMKAAIKNGMRPDMKEIVKQVHGSFSNRVKGTFSKMTPEQIFSTIGDETAEKLQKYMVSRLKTNPPPTNLGGQIPRRKEGAGPETWADWQKSRRK